MVDMYLINNGDVVRTGDGRVHKVQDTSPSARMVTCGEDEHATYGLSIDDIVSFSSFRAKPLVAGDWVVIPNMVPGEPSVLKAYLIKSYNPIFNKFVCLDPNEPQVLHRFPDNHIVRLAHDYEVPEAYRPVAEDIVYIAIPPLAKNPTALALYQYSMSRQLGEDGTRALSTDAAILYKEKSLDACYEEDTKKLMDAYGSTSSEANADKQRGNIQDMLRGASPTQFVGESKNVVDVILYGTNASGVYDLDKVIPFVKMIGCNVKFDPENSGMVATSKQLSVKAFGRKFGLNKWKDWSIIAENLTHEVNKDLKIKYFTDYDKLKKYYTDEACSGDSCMRYSFSSLPLHPCIVYAHDVRDYIENDGICMVNEYVSSDIKLAVLFEDGVATARCMVSSSDRGKAFGAGASTLVKMLGLEGGGIQGSINIVTQDEGDYLMPYIDGSDYVCEDTGTLRTGHISCRDTVGYVYAGVWCDYHGERNPEGDCVWSEHLNSYILSEEAVTLYEGGYSMACADDVYYSHEACEHFVDTSGWSIFNDAWYLTDDVEDIALKHIKANAYIADVIEFAENC